MRAADLRATHRLVAGLAGRELRREGLPPATFGSLRSQELILAKTADRSVLGCMNDMAFLCEVAISTGQGSGAALVPCSVPARQRQRARPGPRGCRLGPNGPAGRDLWPQRPLTPQGKA